MGRSGQEWATPYKRLTKMTPFPWCKRSVRAAELVTEGRLTGAAIAAEVGLSRQGLDRWKARPEFKARVAEILDEYSALLRRDRIARWERETPRGPPPGSGPPRGRERALVGKTSPERPGIRLRGPSFFPHPRQKETEGE